MLALALISLALLAGCAGTIHYDKYAEEAGKHLAAIEQTRQVRAQAYQYAFQHGNASQKNLVLVAMLVEGLTTKHQAIEAPRDQGVAQIAGSVLPWLFGMVGMQSMEAVARQMPQPNSYNQTIGGNGVNNLGSGSPSYTGPVSNPAPMVITPAAPGP